MTKPVGSCLCGAISFDVEGELRGILHCHCVNCRKSSGNFVASSGCATDALTIHDPTEQLRWYDLGYCRYGFCASCGSRMFWQGADHMEHTSIQAGVVDDVSGLPLDGVWFADEAQPHNVPNPRVPHFAGNGDLDD